MSTREYEIGYYKFQKKKKEELNFK